MNSKRSLSAPLTYEELQQKNRELEHELARSKDKTGLYDLLTIMINHVPDLIWAKDMEKRHVIANQADCDKLLRCESPEQAVGKTHAYFTQREREKGNEYTFGEICEDSDEVIKKIKKPRRFLEDGLVNGKYLALDVHKAPIYDDNGEMIGIVGCARDVTKEMQIKREKKELQRQLQQSQKMEAIGTLAGGIAHDLNNILQSISATAESLSMQGIIEKPDLEELENICESAQRGGALIKQLLLFSRKAKTTRQRTNLNQDIRGALEMLERTLPKMITIKTELGAGLKDILADSVQIQQIILNIGSNAVRAMPDGGLLTVKTANKIIETKEAVLAPGNYVQLSIADTGAGMDRETSKRIFEPFFTTREKGKGTGLGLASVYGIVTSHGGRITCTSQPEGGTCFDILLPALKPSDKGPASPPAPAEDQMKGQNETILVVDDEMTIRTIAAKFLSRCGYRVIEAETGEAALEKYPDEKPDLVLLDLSMPGMGGEKCMEQLLKLDPAAKIILASGYFDGAVHTEIQKGKTKERFIQKPYRLKELGRYIRQTLDE